MLELVLLVDGADTELAGLAEVLEGSQKQGQNECAGCAVVARSS